MWNVFLWLAGTILARGGVDWEWRRADQKCSVEFDSISTYGCTEEERYTETCQSWQGGKGESMELWQLIS